MDRFEYLGLLTVGWISLVAVDLQFGTGVLRAGRRLLGVLAICLTLFLAWDSLGVHRGYWRSERRHVAGIWVLPGVPVEEVVLLSMVVFASIVLWRLSREEGRADRERRVRRLNRRGKRP